MKIDCDNLIRALKTLAMSEGLSQKELGASLGFSLNRTKNLFSGRSKLSGEEVLRILTSREHPLPKLADGIELEFNSKVTYRSANCNKIYGLSSPKTVARLKRANWLLRMHKQYRVPS